MYSDLLIYILIYIAIGMWFVLAGRNNIRNNMGFKSVVDFLLIFICWPVFMFYIVSDCCELIMSSGNLFAVEELKTKKRE